MIYKTCFLPFTDPWKNLAIEDYLFRSVKESERILLLYVNDPCVVIGRFQNPLLECNLKLMSEDGIPLVRRQSGGGTVYHDLNNLNFSFISTKRNFNQDFNNEVVKRALKKYGKDIKINARNSYYIGEKKISGSAYKESRGIKFHHGTLLLSSDLKKLTEYLLPKDFETVSCKGIRSIRDEVINLEIDIEKLVSTLVQGFYQSASATEIIDYQSIVKEESFSKTYDLYKSWEWIYAEGPKFSKEITFILEKSKIKVTIFVEKGVLTEIESSALRGELEGVFKAFIGIKLTPESIFRTAELAKQRQSVSTNMIDQLKKELNYFFFRLV